MWTEYKDQTTYCPCWSIYSTLEILGIGSSDEKEFPSLNLISYCDVTFENPRSLLHRENVLCRLYHASPQLFQKEICIWFATREAIDYRNKLFIPEVDAGTACRYGAAVTSLCNGWEESLASSHSPVANKIPSGPGVGGEATTIVVVLPSSGSRSDGAFA
jgi:hypothetical protein